MATSHYTHTGRRHQVVVSLPVARYSNFELLIYLSDLHSQVALARLHGQLRPQFIEDILKKLAPLSEGDTLVATKAAALKAKIEQWQLGIVRN